jgi:hypothetical protein
VLDPRILRCVRTHTPQNSDNSTVTPNESNYLWDELKEEVYMILSEDVEAYG